MKKAFALLFALLFVMSCGGGGGGGDSSPAPAPVDILYEKTRLLRGNWHFVYTIISTWTDDYSLSRIPGDKNPQGGYYIDGINQWGQGVTACYWPNDGNWTLGDYNSSIIDIFYVFYTDGITILPNSCYYQINISTGEWSPCFSLSGWKTSTIPDHAVENQSISNHQRENQLLQESTNVAPIDDNTKEKYLYLKNKMSQSSISRE